MKKLFSFVICLFAYCIAFSQNTGKIMDNLSMESKILGMERKYAIYLPPDYETSERSYPVLYLLHGMGDDQTGWVQFGEVGGITDQAIKEGVATPMIIVMPDANTKYQGYFNHPNGNYDYENFFFEEFIPYIEKTYRCRTEKRGRAVAGLSMGGGGTLVYALHRPDLFAAACPLSAAVRQRTNDTMRSHYAKEAPGKSEAEINEWYKNYDILQLVEDFPEDKKSAVRWYIDCGDDDFLTEGNSLLHIAMTKKGIPHEFRMRDGQHNWSYWRGSLPEVLRFVSGSFRQN